MKGRMSNQELVTPQNQAYILDTASSEMGQGYIPHKYDIFPLKWLN